MTLILKAEPVVDKRVSELRQECDILKRLGIHPKLVVVLVGENPASLSYIRNKQKLCEKVGCLFELRQLPATTSKSTFQDTLRTINTDASVHGCIIQLPVAGEAGSLPIEQMVLPSKDVDGFHPSNTASLYLGKIGPNSLLPCTPKGVMSLLKHYGIPILGAHVVVVGRSQIVGKPLSLLLGLAGATVTMCHSQTKDLAHHTRHADIVVSAIGKGHFLGPQYFDPARKTVVIDVGMNKNADGKLVGDVAFDSVAPLVAAITPVPGGVGPMTVLSLIENLLTAAQNQKDHP